MRNLVLQDVCNIPAAIFEDELAATGMAVEKVCDVVYFGPNGNVARLLVVVRGHLGARDGRKGTAWHRGCGRHAEYARDRTSRGLEGCSAVVLTCGAQVNAGTAATTRVGGEGRGKAQEKEAPAEARGVVRSERQRKDTAPKGILRLRAKESNRYR